jgi:hypothetical protein
MEDLAGSIVFLLSTSRCEMPFLHAPSLSSIFLVACPRVVREEARWEHSK